MSNFPNNFDDDTTLPFVNDDSTEMSGEAINALRDATFATQQYLGLGAAGSTASIAARLGVSLQPDGYIKPSVITSLGLVTLPITASQIADDAEVPESKLKLDHRTNDLYNYIRDLSKDINTAIGWIATTGIKLEPHLMGAIYRHTMAQVDVSTDTVNLPFLRNKFDILRNNSNSYTLISDINAELLSHQFADGSPAVPATLITTYNGSTYPATHAHTSSGVFLNTSRFSTIPQTANDLQAFAEYIDSASIFLLGTRIHNLYTNGVSKISRSSVFLKDDNDNFVDGYGQTIIPSTPAISYLLNLGADSSPFDDIDTGDDIIEFKPSTSDINSHSFDSKFALVKVGDIVRINYGGTEVKHIVKEKKYIQNAGDKKYVIRIEGKNLAYTPNAEARIDRPLANNNKYGVLAMAAVNNGFTAPPSLIIGNPRGAQALGNGFNPDQLDPEHYLLHLALYPTGNPSDGYTILPPIDVTGNQGATPGKYTLEGANGIVETTNKAFRQAGYNYRFIAFAHQGNFGIMLAESYNNAAFSILSAVVAPDGSLDENGTSIAFENNVVDLFPRNDSFTANDPLGLGPSGSGVASPPYMGTYGSAEASQFPTKIFVPHKRNSYYINGVEREKLTLEVGQTLDTYGDGYWVGEIVSKTIIPGPSPTGRVQVTYRIPLDLENSNLQIGKTIVIQSYGQGSLVDFGRFAIQSITFGCEPDKFTEITVYDAVHGTGLSPTDTLAIGAEVAIYFNSDSVSFNAESATDFTSISPFKRHFEVYIDQNGHTFTHERARINASSSTILGNGSVPLRTYSELNKLNIIKVSPKLRGHQFGYVNKITLNMLSLNSSTGEFTGYLANYDGTVFSKKGPVTTGRIGQITRFYDETNIDYVDIVFELNETIGAFTNQVIDIQLFPTLSLDDELMLLGTCQVNDVTNTVGYMKDERQFGNTSEKDLSTSAHNYISLPEKLLHGNGVIRGFDLENNDINDNPNGEQIYLTGGIALVNGKIVYMNDETVVIPVIQELVGSTSYGINWVVCVNDKSEYKAIPLLDYDPVLGTPNNASRLFQARNPSTGTNYYIDASTFSDILNKRKDLTPIYTVSSTVALVSSSYVATLNVSDVRHYVNDVDLNLPLRLTSSEAQGNFKSPIAVINWLKYNVAFNSTAYLKTPATINEDVTFNFSNPAVIDGEGSGVLTITGQATLGSNITFKNLSLNFTGGVAVSAGAANIIFENCDITVDVPSTPPTDNVVFNFVDSDNVIVKNCSIDVNYSASYSSAFDFRGAAFRLDNTTNFEFSDNDLNLDYVATSGSVTPGDAIVLIDSPGAIIRDSSLSGNYNKHVYLTGTSHNVKLQNLTLTSSYNPNGDIYEAESGTITYTASDLVNSGQGWVYAPVSANLDNLVIENVTFNYTPDVANNNRFSFINLELLASTSSINNLVIKDCKFNNTVASGSVDDLRAAIAIINRVTGLSTTDQKPVVKNAYIRNNVGNKNQSIILTSETVADLDVTGSRTMTFPGLAAQNVTIENNILGTIGYWTAQVNKIRSIPPNVISTSDKDSGLTIRNNVCHLITNVDHTGQFFLVSKFITAANYNQSRYPSGHVVIDNNRVSWIHVGISYEENSSLKITDNSLAAYDTYHLTQIGHTGTNVYGRSNEYAIFVGTNKHVVTTTQTPAENNDSSVIISGNTTETGHWLGAFGETLTYNYTGYIFSQSSSVQTHNILKGVGTAGDGYLVMVGGINNIITHNKIYRDGNAVGAYVGFSLGSYETPVWGGDTAGLGAGTTGIVTDNYFDSPYLSNAATSETLVWLPGKVGSRWTVERNKNQTGYAAYSLVNQLGILTGNVTTTAVSGVYMGPYDDRVLANLSTGTAQVGILDTFDYQTGGTQSPLRAQSLHILDPSSANGEHNFGTQINVDSLCPPNVRILSVDIKFRKIHLVTQVGAMSYFSLTMSSLNDYTLYDSTSYTGFNNGYVPDPAVADLNSGATSVYEFVSANEINANYATGQINLESYGRPFTSDTLTDVSQDYVTGKGKNISIGFRFSWQKTTTSAVSMAFSPIRIKYRW